MKIINNVLMRLKLKKRYEIKIHFIHDGKIQTLRKSFFTQTTAIRKVYNLVYGKKEDRAKEEIIILTDLLSNQEIVEVKNENNA